MMERTAQRNGLVVIADTQEECISRPMPWKADMESKGLRVNMKKTKFLFSGDGHPANNYWQTEQPPMGHWCSQKSIAKRDRAFKKAKRRNSPSCGRRTEPWGTPPPEPFDVPTNAISKTSLVTWTRLPQMTSLRALNASGGRWSPTNVNALVHNMGNITLTSTKPRCWTTSSRVPSLGRVYMDNVPSPGGSPPTPCALKSYVPTQALSIKLLKNLQSHKATRPDCLPLRILHDLAKVIAPPLTLIFQQIYDTGNTPQDWRDAILSPIYKKGCKHDPQNYRLVSLTSITCKIDEHFLCSTMMTHLDTCGILTNDQHGSRKGLSTETQLLAAVHDWSHTLHKGGQTDVLLLDFSKAFDCPS